MDLCHLKNAELEKKHQKYKSRVVLRGDIVKDDSGSHAVFTEQGSSASRLTAAKSNGYHFKVTRMRRKSSRCGICLHSRLRMQGAPKLLEVPKSECPDVWIRLPRHI